MLPQLCFFVSIAFGFIAWGIVATRYIWPKLRLLRRAEALRPLLPDIGCLAPSDAAGTSTYFVNNTLRRFLRLSPN
jgi:hypothetical protein